MITDTNTKTRRTSFEICRVLQSHQALLLKHYLLTCNDEMGKQNCNDKHHKGNRTEHLLTVYMNTEEHIAVGLDGRQNLAAHKRCAKAKQAADAVFNGRRLCKILAVHVAIRNVCNVTRNTRHADVIQDRIYDNAKQRDFQNRYR